MIFNHARSSHRLIAALLVVGLSAVIQTGCATTPRIPVPNELASKVEVKGVGRVRGWGDTEIENIDQLVGLRFQQIGEKRPQLLKQRRPTMSYLALSGGGANGAFGAGLINGWTASGKRPEFEIVSGVSTGALMAPFAFLGPAYDKAIREIYTQYSTKDLLRKQVLAGLTGGNALSDTTPLKNLIAKYISRRVFNAIAAEHAKGRRLLVGTTNLDADRPMVWDMGRIAQRGNRRALALFRSVLLASASLPGLFPPVYVKVTDGNKTYEEMHVDGGTTDNAFLLPLHLDFKKIGNKRAAKFRRRIYIIANDKTGPSPEVTKNSALAIAGRSIATLIKQQLQGDLIKLYLRAKSNRIAYNLASIPLTFNEKSNEPFDRAYMKKLYALGFELGRNGYKWANQPPGI